MPHEAKSKSTAPGQTGKSASPPQQTSTFAGEQMVQAILTPNGKTLTPEVVRALQQSHGNQYVQRLISQKNTPNPPVPVRTHAPHNAVIQPRLDGFDAYLRSIDDETTRVIENTWSKLCKAVNQYNVARNQNKLADANKLLAQIEQHANNWLTKSAGRKAKSKKANDEAYKQKNAAKVSALKQLLVRVSQERQEMQTEPNAPAQGPDNVTQNTPFAHEGAMSTLAKVTYANDPTNEQFFSQEATNSPGRDNAGYRTGIPAEDPNFAGRAIAMAKIDQLITDKMNQALKASGNARVEQNSLVETSFAVNRMPEKKEGSEEVSIKPKPGIVMEAADGKEMRKGYTKSGNAQVPGSGMNAPANAMSFEDPVLMKGLNKLQILDGICAQVDRHQANYYVETNATGAVQGVQGIDNDMAFGQDMKDPQDAKVRGEIKDKAYRGLPPIVDAEVRAAVLAISANDIQTALKGLLSAAEIAATVARLVSTQVYLAKLKPEDIIKAQEWQTKGHELAGKQTSENSYLGSARGEFVNNNLDRTAIDTQMRTEVKRLINGPERNNFTDALQASKMGVNIENDFDSLLEKVAGFIASNLYFMVVSMVSDSQNPVNTAILEVLNFIPMALPQIYVVIKAADRVNAMGPAVGDKTDALGKQYLKVRVVANPNANQRDGVRKAS